MVSRPQQEAETAYLDIFGIISEHADYLEPEDGADFLLAEALIASITTTVLHSFLAGAFEQFGKSLGVKIKTRLFKSEQIISSPPDEVIAELAKLMAQRVMTARQVAGGKDFAHKTLTGLGLTEELAGKVSQEITAALLKHHG